MLVTQIRNSRLAVCLSLVLLAATASLFSSCATQQPRTALINDPDSQSESTIPWNKPAKWESGANVPGGIAGPGGGINDPSTGY